MENKKEMRKYMLEKRRELDLSEVEKCGDRLLAKLLKNECFSNAETVFIYVSAKNELKTVQTVEYLISKGVCVCVPKTFEDGTMKAVIIKNVEKDLILGRFGIHEPVNCLEDQIAVLRDTDLVIVPGVAFDRLGNRVGYGAGYYDKYFGGLRKQGYNPYKIGVCYDFQLLNINVGHLCNEFDVKMDLVIDIPAEL